MKELEKMLMLKIYVGEDDKYKGQNLYEHIFNKAKEYNLAGATCLRGILGYGHSKKIHSTKFIRLFSNMPIVIELIDKEENIQEFLDYVRTILDKGLISVSEVSFLPIYKDED